MDRPNETNDSTYFKNSFHDAEFMESRQARPIRVMCEYIEPEARFRRLNVKNTVVLFGSARTKSPEEAEEGLRVATKNVEENKSSARYKKDLLAAQQAVSMSRYYADAASLAHRITEWSAKMHKPSRRFYVCSGGGPGIMEAANRGAHEAGGRSVGLNISLPFEQEPNTYQSPELAFEFHYFFMRKFWFVYLAKALIVFPGGFGTMDEMFELLTIVQTEKTSKYMPIILYGSEYWNDIINFEALERWGMIDAEDLSLFRFCDTVDDAFNNLTSEFNKLYPPNQS